MEVVILIAAILVVGTVVWAFCRVNNGFAERWRKFKPLAKYFLSIFGAFTGLLLSFIAHDYLKEKDNFDLYQEAVRRVAKIALDHVVTMNHFEPFVMLNQDDPEQLMKLYDQIVSAERRMTRRVASLFDESVFVESGSTQYRSQLDYMALMANTRSSEPNAIEALDHNRRISSLLSRVSFFELMWLRGALSHAELDSGYACMLDVRRFFFRGDGSTNEWCEKKIVVLQMKMQSYLGIGSEEEGAAFAENLEDCFKGRSKLGLGECKVLVERLVR